MIASTIWWNVVYAGCVQGRIDVILIHLINIYQVPVMSNTVCHRAI